MPLVPFVAAVVWVLVCGCPRLACGLDRPNVVVFLADDLGWKDVGFHQSEINTPHLDRLAAQGTELTQFYVQPVCSPTRGAFLSGKYAANLGLQCGVVRPWATHGLPLDVVTLPQLLRDAGYVTAICGKWHLGHAAPAQLPLSRGFARQYGHYNGALDYFTHLRDGGLDWHRDQTALEEEGYSTTLLGNEATRLVQEHDFAKQPLFLYVPFNAPHTPLQAPEEYLAQYREIKAAKRRTFAAMVTCLDDAVGRVMSAVDAAGQADRTLILFFSDNGGPEDQGADNGLLRDGKGSLYEGGVRVPAVASWPSVVPAGGKATGMMHVADLLPTLLAVAGVEGDRARQIDGVNQWPVILGKAPAARTEILLNTTPFHGAIRLGDWKLIRNGHISANAVRAEGPQRVELFHIADDPYEQHDLAESHPDELAELTRRLDELQSAAMPPNIPPNKMPASFTVPKVW